MGKDDDDVWQAIVDNYGERAALDPDPEPAPEAIVDTSYDADDDETWVAEPAPTPSGWDEETVDSDWTTDRFVPPPPPPVPSTTPDRMLAWVGIFGSPLVLLVFLILHLSLPRLLAYLLVVGFVGGFVYLVIQMPREPRDPYDDGAVL